MNKREWEQNNKYFQFGDIVVYKKYSYKFHKFELKFAKLIWDGYPMLILLNKNLTNSNYKIKLKKFECDGEWMRFRHLNFDEEQKIKELINNA